MSTWFLSHCLWPSQSPSPPVPRTSTAQSGRRAPRAVAPSDTSTPNDAVVLSIEAIQLAGSGRLFREIGQFGRGRLHAESEFIGGDACLQGGFPGVLLQMPLVDTSEACQACPADRLPSCPAGGFRFRIGAGPSRRSSTLIGCRQETGTVNRRAALDAAFEHHNETRAGSRIRCRGRRRPTNPCWDGRAATIRYSAS